MLLALLAWLGSWALGGCERAPLPKSSTLYRTTRGGPAVSWDLDLMDKHPTRPGVVRRRISHSSAERGVSDGFDWQLDPWGDTGQLRMDLANSVTRLRAGDVAQLKINGTAVFYGATLEPPSLLDPDVREVVLEGGRSLLGRVLMDGRVYSNTGVNTIARDLLARLVPETLDNTASQIASGPGATVTTFYMPTAPLDSVFEELAKLAGGVRWGVDAEGRVFFGKASPAALTVGYAGQPWGRLRVQGKDSVSVGIVRVITDAGGSRPPDQIGAYSASGAPDAPYLPATLTVRAMDSRVGPRIERAVSAPPGVGFVGPYPAAEFLGTTSSGVTNPGNATDFGQDTYATFTGAGAVLRVNVNGASYGRAVGVQLRLRVTGNARAYVDVAHSGSGGLPGAFARWVVEPGDDIQTLTALLPPYAGVGEGNIYNTVIAIKGPVSAPGPDDLRLYDVQVMKVMEPQAYEYARSLWRPLSSTPAEVRLAGLQGPSPTLTVTGSPDGDVSGEPRLYEYSYRLATDAQTVARLGSDGQSDDARAIRLAAR